MKRKLVTVGPFGKSVPADSRNVINFKNEQLFFKGIKPDYIFIGDSITQHWDTSLYFSDLGISTNRGIGMDDTYYIFKRAEADVFQFEPKNIVYLAGINDLLTTEPDRWWRKEGKNEKEVISSLLENIKNFKENSGKAKVFFCSVLPVDMCEPYDNNRYAKMIKTVNKGIKALCDGSKYIFVDFYSELEENGRMKKGLTADGIHPLGKCYEIMSQVLRNEIKKIKSK